MPIKDIMTSREGRCPINVFFKSPLKPVSQHREGNGSRTHEQVCSLRVLVAQVDQGKVTGLTQQLVILTWDMTQGNWPTRSVFTKSSLHIGD